MVLALRELLERIRPVGTPGAPTGGERQRQRDERATEVAAVVALLTEFEAEADSIAAAAELDGQRAKAQARRQAAQIAASLTERVATAGAEIAANDERVGDTEERAIRAEAEQDAARLISSSETAIPELVDRAVQVIWDSVTSVAPVTTTTDRSP